MNILPCIAKDKYVDIKIIQTSDIHGNYFPYNFITRTPGKGSLSRIYSFIKEQRRLYKNNMLLLDNGDILQGQPTAYYYNFMDTTSQHIASSIMNYMKYDVGNVGNHDIETGHKVFDRWISSCKFPVLGANIIDMKTQKPYLAPYKIFKKSGIKIAVLGMITPGIPAWLPESLWHGLRFDDMELTARKWIKIIQDKEHPDIIIGLFHAGQSGNLLSGKYNENPSLLVAENVPGFNIVLMGHDHIRECKKILNVAGDSVLIMDPANNGNVVSEIDIRLTKRGKKILNKEISGKLTDMNKYEPDPCFLDKFNAQYNAVNNFVSKKIGYFENSISTRDSYFRPSAFIDFLHTLQLNITGAEISFVAPLSFDARINKGDVFMSDMFNLYKYENMLYVMNLSGKEIKDYLEYVYYLWTNQMESKDDNLLLYKNGTSEGEDYRAVFLNQSYNFDSAAGIVYTVDVSQPLGQKISIKSMADGSPFDMNRMYKVALNSYRGNGGGDILTKGAGIPQEELSKRIVFSTDKDLRFYLIKYIEQKKVLNPQPLNTWKFIPEDWADYRKTIEYPRLFGNNK